MLLLLVVITLLLYCTCDTKDDDGIPRVAFVFAGSARSFVMAPVHESIRHNLLNALCPEHNCKKHVFLRISNNDNVHRDPNSLHGQRSKSSKGISLKVTDDFIALIQHAIMRLVLDTILASKRIHTEWCTIGSAEELASMRQLFPGLRHKIFQELDSRRYSMNFQRWSSYQMAVQYEKEANIKFDWIVMARLDTLWGSPIQHISKWESKVCK
jgi:hypothetical protein